jgi:hypothetical protein
LFGVIQEVAKATANANQVVGQVGHIAADLNSKILAIDPEKFDKLDKATKAVDKVIQGINLANAALDTTAVKNLKVGDLDSAAVWGQQIGQIFQQMGSVLGNVFDEIPGGHADATGLFNAPANVINAFTDVLRSHYAHIDEMVGNVGQGVLLPDGAEGPQEQLPKE